METTVLKADSQMNFSHAIIPLSATLGAIGILSQSMTIDPLITKIVAIAIITLTCFALLSIFLKWLRPDRIVKI